MFPPLLRLGGQADNPQPGCRDHIGMRMIAACLVGGSALWFVPGCSDGSASGRGASNESLPAPIQAAPVEPGQAAASDPPVQPRKIIGKTTQDVRDAETEEAKGARRVQPRVTGQDPITVSASAYTAIVGRLEQSLIEDAVKKFHAINERYPKDIDEFMREIIKANGIRLPQLPFYQEYGYDVKEHKLVILEYPDKKALLPGGN